MNYAVEEAKNIERYTFSFMRATKSHVHKKYNVCNFPVFALYTSRTLSVSLLVGVPVVCLLSPGQHCFLHSAAL